MKTSKLLFRIIAAMALLAGWNTMVEAQLVIGSWQNNSGDGWTDSSGVSITNAANYPAKYQFETNVVAGYPQSLGLHETGFGNTRLMINLTTIPGAVAAFTNGNKLQFTFSCPPDTGAGAGFMQLVQFQWNSTGSGFQQITGNWASNGFSETGSTGNNSGGQPVFDFFAGAQSRSQVVTWDYTAIKSNIMSTGIGFLQLTFVFQTGGGAPTNVLMNNVVLLGTTPTIIVDQFNPTNNPFAGTNIYANGNITNIYANWFGSAFSNVVWDATMDAQSNANSGSLKITAVFGTNGGGQFTLENDGPGFDYAGISPPITNGIGLLTFQCDVRYDPSSPTWVNGGVTNFGNLRFGVVPPFSPQDFFGGVQVSVTNTGWVHVTLPLNAATDPNLLSISGLIINEDGQSFGNLQGTTTLWIDNMEFTYTNITFVPPPTLSISTPVPAMRLFAGSAGQFDRQEVATVDQSQSWIGGSYPVSYSFKVLNVPATINQTHIFLIPVNSTPGAAPYGYNGVDFTATNGLWLTIGSGGTAVLSWKVNQPGQNAYQAGTIALTETNTTAVGTWTLTFTGPADGTLTGPTKSQPFHIADPNVSTDFANPMVAYFGLQGNNSPGTYEDWASITVTGVAGVNESEDFTAESGRNISGLWNNMSGAAADLVVTTTNDLPAYWVSWTLPAVGFNIGTSISIPSTQWINPAFYSDYDNGQAPFGMAQQYGPNTWIMLPFEDFPTTDGNLGSPKAPNAFFILSTNVVNPFGG